MLLLIIVFYILVNRFMFYVFKRLHLYCFASLQPNIFKPGWFRTESAVDDIQLVFNSLAPFCRKVNDFLCFLIRYLTIRIDEFHHARECLADGKMVALGKRAVKLGIIIQQCRAIVIAQSV